jgi:hypothetical protein
MSVREDDVPLWEPSVVPTVVSSAATGTMKALQAIRTARISDNNFRLMVLLI